MNSVPLNSPPPSNPLVTLTLHSPLYSLSDDQQQKLNKRGNFLFERSFQEIKEEKKENGRRFSYPPPNSLNKSKGEEEISNFESKNKFLSILSDEMVQKKSLMTEKLDDSFKNNENELFKQDKQDENDIFLNAEEFKKNEEKPTVVADKAKNIFNRLGSLFKEEMAEAEIQTFHSSTDSLEVFREFDEQNEDDYRKKIITDDILKNMIKMEKENDLLEEKKENDELTNYFEQEKEFREKFQSYINKGYFLDLIEMNNLQAARNYYDGLPFLGFRKKLIVLDNYFSVICSIIVQSKIFEFMSLLVILANSIILSLTMSKVISSDLADNTELIFLILYTMEMALKIQAFGFIIPPDSYIKDYWNILDFVIVLTSYLPYVMEGQSANITVLRAFRVLRPLRTISKMKKLRIILEVIFDSMNNMKDVLILMVFFYTICAIAGLQLLSGSLKKRCLQEKTGFPIFNSNDYTLCNDDCDPGYFCGKLTSNPNDEITNFDTFPWSFLQVYQVVTMEGWTQIMIFVQRVFSPWMWIYFYGIVFIGAFFLQNMMLAVISFYYHYRYSQNANDKKKKVLLSLDLKRTKKLGLFHSYHDVKEKRKKVSLIQKLKEFGQRISSIPKTPFNFLNKENKVPKKSSCIVEGKSSALANPQPFGISLIPIIENANEANSNSPTAQKGMNLLTTPSSRRHSDLKKTKINRLMEKSKSAKRFSIGENFNLIPKTKINNNTIQINGNNNKALRLSGMILKGTEQKRKLSRFDTFSRAIEDDDSFMRELEKKKNDLERKSFSPKGLGSPTTPNSKTLSILELTARKKIQSVIQNINFQQIIRTTVGESSNGSQKRGPSKSNTMVSNTKISKPEDERNHFKLISNFSFKINGNQNSSSDFLDPMNKSSSRKLLAKKHDFAEDEDFKIITPTSKNEENKSGTEPINSFSSFSNYVEENKKKHHHHLPEKGKVRHNTNFSPSTSRSNNPNKRQSRKIDLGEEYVNMIEQIDSDSEDERIKKKAKNKKLIIRIRQDIDIDEENSSIHDVLSNLKKEKLEKEMSKKLGEFKEMPSKLRYTLEKRLQDLTQSQSKKNRRKIKKIDDENYIKTNVSGLNYINNMNRTSLSNSSSFLYESSCLTKSALMKKITLNSRKRMEDFSTLKYFKHNLKQEYSTKFKLPLFFSFFFLHRNNLLASESVHPSHIITPKKIVSIRREGNDNDFSKKLDYSSSTPVLNNNGLVLSKENANLKKRSKKKTEKNIEWNLESAREKILGISPLKNDKTSGSRLPTTKSEEDNVEAEGKLKGLLENSDTNLYNKKIFKDLDSYNAKHLSKRNSYKAKKIKKRKLIKGIPFQISEAWPNNEILKRKQRPFEFSEVWSGNDVLSLCVSQNNTFMPKIISRLNRVVGSLNATKRDFNIWSANLFSCIFSFFSNFIYRMIMTKTYENSIMLCVFINTFILAMDGLITNETSVEIMNNFSLSFTIIFAIDMGFKIIGLGIIDYLRDQMNIFDGCVVILSLIELGILSGGGGSAFNAFRSVRIFRAFRVLRVSRLVRSLRYMKIIANAIAKSIESFAYIALMLGIFIYIYALLGLQLFSTGYNDNLSVYRANFKTITNSFIAAFQILTIENWNSIMVDLFNNDVNATITTFYLFSWIFIGNYILLNLFVAVLLEGFDGQEEELVESDEENNKEENEINFRKAMNLKISKNSSTKEPENMKESTQDEWDKQKIKYEDIVCEVSIYLFPKDNAFRKKSFEISQSRYFEQIILFVILLSSIKLVIDTYFKENDEDYVTISDLIDYTFTAIFTFESVFKIISLGFVMESNSYLRESWSILDFIIVIFSLIDLVLTNYDLSFIKILRLLRILRPLRFISHNKNMKIVVNSLLKSLPGLGNVLIFIFLIWLMFGILGINFMSGKMGYCTESLNVKKYIYGMSKSECLKNGYYWLNNLYNFDNIIYGMITLFILSTFEGWPDIMFNFFDGDDPESGPSYENTSMIGYFIIGFIMVGSIFLMNLFIAVISREFKVAQKSERKSILTEDEERWIDFQKLIALEKFDYFSLKTPDDFFRKKLFFILKSRFFEPFIILCICANIITMGMTYEGSPATYDSTLENINLGFTSVFILEFIMKIIAFGFKGYFHSGWNQFDFVVVSISIVDIFLSLLGGSFMRFVKIGPQIGRIFRVMRITRLLKLIKSFKNLRNLIQIAIYTLPALLNVATLTFLFFFIYAILGNQLFAGKRGDTLSEFQNFDNFGNSMMTLFRCATGENWYLIMFDTMQDSKYNSLFFLTFILVGQFVMLNLFVLVILDQFDANYNNPDNPLQLQNFQEDMETFKEVWVSMTAKDYGIKINQKNLVDFFLKLDQPLGFCIDEEIQRIKNDRNFEDKGSSLLKSKTKRDEEINRKIEEKIEKAKLDMKKKVCKVIMKMDLYSDSEGYIYFNELLFHIFKNYYYRECFGTINSAAEAKLNEEESKSLEKIKNLRKKIHIDHNKITMDNEETIIKQNKVNPLTNMIYLRLCFKSWTKFVLLNEESKFTKIALTKAALKEKNYKDLDPLNYNEILDEIEQEKNISSILSSSSSSSGSEAELLRENEFDFKNEEEHEIANPNTGLKNIYEDEEYEKNEDSDMASNNNSVKKFLTHIEKKNTSKFKVEVIKIETNNQDLEANNDDLSKNENYFDFPTNQGAENDNNEQANHVVLKEEEEENNISESEFANLDEYDEESGRKKKKNVTKIINYQINNNVVINNNYYIGSPKEAELRKNSSI